MSDAYLLNSEWQIFLSRQQKACHFRCRTFRSRSLSVWPTWSAPQMVPQWDGSLTQEEFIDVCQSKNKAYLRCYCTNFRETMQPYCNVSIGPNSHAVVAV